MSINQNAVVVMLETSLSELNARLKDFQQNYMQQKNAMEVARDNIQQLLGAINMVTQLSEKMAPLLKSEEAQTEAVVE